jgi:hypothetical protein
MQNKGRYVRDREREAGVQMHAIPLQGTEGGLAVCVAGEVEHVVEERFNRPAHKNWACDNMQRCHSDEVSCQHAPSSCTWVLVLTDAQKQAIDIYQTHDAVALGMCRAISSRCSGITQHSNQNKAAPKPMFLGTHST